MSNTNKIITFQDWRFCNKTLVELLINYRDYKFIGFNWQVLYKDEKSLSENWNKSTIEISTEQAQNLYKSGDFPEIQMAVNMSNTFHNSCWGHYCIDKELWLEINGIDEVVTNTRHYADLDINTRLEYYFKINHSKIEIPMIKNAMVRIMHSKGNFFGGSNIELDSVYNNKHLSCCFSKSSSMNDKVFTDYVVNKIEKQEFIKLYQINYSEDFVKNNKDEKLDKEHGVIGFQCIKCQVIGETPHWYEKSPNSKTKSLIGIGLYEIKLGRNLMTINNDLSSKNFEEKIKILNNSWYTDEYLK